MRGQATLTKDEAEKLVRAACSAMSAELARLRAELEQAKALAFYAFVEGAAWWQFEGHGSTMFGSEREQAEAAAASKYPYEPHPMVGELRAALEQTKAATDKALELALRYGGIDGDHHKAWVIDQMVRALLVTEPEYTQWVKDACDGEDGPNTYEWDTGVIP